MTLCLHDAWSVNKVYSIFKRGTASDFIDLLCREVKLAISHGLKAVSTAIYLSQTHHGADYVKHRRSVFTMSFLAS